MKNCKIDGNIFNVIAVLVVSLHEKRILLSQGNLYESATNTPYRLPFIIGGNMREILFRGKRIDNGKWVQGDYVSNGCGIAYTDYLNEYGDVGDVLSLVIPETIGQYTGVTIGAEKLFEGDIVEWHEDYDDTWGYSQTATGRSVVIWDKENFCWSFETDGYIQPFNDWNWNSSFIVGNIHDNPELLEV